MRRIIGEYQGSEEDLIEHIKNIYTGEEQATSHVAREYEGPENTSLDAPDRIPRALRSSADFQAEHCTRTGPSHERYAAKPQ
ncbi:hypothetical protein MTO96_042106 [Rhipicephalus appendiculatus]